MNTHPDSECFLAYAPRGGGLLCAVVYRVRGDDVYGWWVGRDVNLEYAPGFFMLENYYTTHEQAFLTTRGGDLPGGWIRDYDARQPVLDTALPVEEAVARALELAEALAYVNVSIYREASPGELRKDDIERAEQGIIAVTGRTQ